MEPTTLKNDNPAKVDKKNEEIEEKLQDQVKDANQITQRKILPSDKLNILEGYENMGCDTNGCTYKSIEAMWTTELTEKNVSKVTEHIGSKQSWYKQARDYWKDIENNYNGVLGGLHYVNGIDIHDSRKNLEIFKTKHQMGNQRCLECGAGVGRITKELLSDYFEKVDLLEPDEGFMNQAKESLKDNEKAGKFYMIGMEELDFEFKYDCVWIQWVIGHLTDEDLVNFLKKCKVNLNPGGVIIIKDNIASSIFVVDKSDCSIVRNDDYFKKIFDKADLNLIFEKRFNEMPQDCYEVKTYGLR